MLKISVSKLPSIAVLFINASIIFALDARPIHAQSQFQTAGSSYTSPLTGDKAGDLTSGITALPAGSQTILNSDRSSFSQFKSIVDIEKSNPYAALSTPKAQDSDGQYIGRANLSPASLNDIAKPAGAYGNLYDSRTVQNPFGQYSSANSVSSSQNPYAAGSGPLINSRDQRPTYPNYERLGGGIQRWYP